MRILVTADLHIRGENPRCRLDSDWIESQRKDIHVIIDSAKALEVDCVCLVGDIFEQARASTEAVNMALSELGRIHHDNILILPGNHDLLYHSYAELERSSIGILLKKFPELGKDMLSLGPHPTWDAQPFGQDKPGTAPVRFVHRLVFPNAEARPIDECGQTAEEIAEEFKGNDIIICGDYHHAFEVRLPSGQTVINPGCINIQKADMIGYRPRFCIVEWEKGPRPIQPRVSWHHIPQPEGAVVSDTYLEADKERDERMEAFLSTVEGSASVSLSFRDNLEKAAGKAPAEVKAVITEILQELGNEAK